MTTVIKCQGVYTGGKVSVVNGALSKKLEMNIWREGHHYQQTYSDGVPDSDIQMLEETDRTGTQIRFLSGPDVFTLGLRAVCDILA